MERDFTICSTPSYKVSFPLYILLFTVAFLSLNIHSAKAQCSAGAPYLCITVNPTSSGITTTTVDISAVTGTSSWQWLDRVGVVWSTVANPTITTNGGIQMVTLPASSTLTGTLPAFTITGLTPGTTYYLRAFATYSYPTESTSWYGTPITFTTISAGPIAMTTTPASTVSSTSAVSGGSATIMSGTPTIVERGVVYSTSTNPTVATGTKVISGSGPGTFVANLTGLSSSTTYYVRSYSIDNLGNVYYGSNDVFTTSFMVSGVVSPFSLSPSWHFGAGAKYTFPSGSYPAVPPGPTVGSTSTTDLVETSTDISFRDGSSAFYSNTMFAYNGGNTAIRNLISDGTCGGSSTGGGVAFPDPANDATNNAFYMVIGNDLTGGLCAGAGVNRYRFTGTGTTVAFASGPVNMASSAISSEAITAGTDGSGGYWVVTHDQNANNNFYVWHFTAAGVSAMATYTPATSATIDFTTSGGYLKFSPCMDKIAFAGFNGAVTVYNFNRTTGAIGAEIAYKTGIGKVGLEFSPNGQRIYYSGQGDMVRWFLISNPATGGNVTGSNSWTMQMGPDAQIYTSGVQSATTVGRINDPDGTPTNTAIALPAGKQTYRGITNIAWLSPRLPKINVTSTGCNTYDFTAEFKNYFNDDVTVKTGTYSWNFGDLSAAGSGKTTSHTYPPGTNTYTVTLTLRDSCCNQLWTATTTINTSCVPLPVSLMSFKGRKNEEGNGLYWATSSETNNDYFEIMKSDDGINFYSIGKVKGTNSISGVSNYNFTDYTGTIKSVSYYYLAQYDKDGTLTKSEVVAIRSIAYTPVVSPNPSNSNFTVSLPYDKTAEITIMDMLGRVIEKRTMQENSSFVTIGDELSKGSYVISIVTEYDSFFYKVIKE